MSKFQRLDCVFAGKRRGKCSALNAYHCELSDCRFGRTSTNMC